MRRRPTVVRKRPDDRRRLGRHLGEESIRIAVILLIAAWRHYGIFVVRPRREPWQKNLPQAAVPQTHRMARSIPTVVVAGDADHFGIRSPHRKTNALDAFAGDRVRPQRSVAFVVGALAMQVQFESGQQGREAVRILQLFRFAREECNAQAIFRRVRLRYKESCRMRALHRNDLVAHEHGGVFGLWKPGADLPFVWTQVRERIAMAALYDQLSLSCGHLS